MKQLSVVKKPWVGLRNETQPNDLKMLGFTIVWPNLRSDYGQKSERRSPRVC
jgi:hypothetical protein